MTDYTKIFDSPEQLADFVLLPLEQQRALLAQRAEEGGKGLEIACDIPHRSRMAGGE